MGTELRNILHLSLPDNMLGIEDAEMLGQLLRKNTPLQKLDLSQNSLDADCAALLADSLIYNTNLVVLDVSHNILGDLGIYQLLCPLIRKKLHELQITSDIAPEIPIEMRKLSKKFIVLSSRSVEPPTAESTIATLYPKDLACNAAEVIQCSHQPPIMYSFVICFIVCL